MIDASDGFPVRTRSAAPDDGESEFIRIRGARANNLKNVDLDIPRQQLVVMTGVSGSGKSSLAFDTLYAEGQRQYIESLSVYARQYIRQMERPDVDLIDGLQPTVCIDQRPGAHNPRSTVATVTEIYDYLRLLISRLGSAYCYSCGEPIRQQNPQEIHARLMRMPEGTKAMIMAPLVRGRRGQHRELLEQIRKAGLVRARIDGEVFDIGSFPELNARKVHHIEAIVDRVIIRESVADRIEESSRLALKIGEGRMIVCYLDINDTTPERPQGCWKDALFSTLHACPSCEISFEELEPRTFSFNSPYGACLECEGLGVREQFDPESVVSDMSLSLADGALAPYRNATARQLAKLQDELEPFFQSHRSLQWDTPLCEFKPSQWEKFLHGSGRHIGLLNVLEKDFSTVTKASRRELLEQYRDRVTCHACNGSRLRPEALSVRLGELAIHEITRMDVNASLDFFQSLKFDEEEQPIATPVLDEITNRLAFLKKVGADYLTLDRPAHTLSGGELQRVRLATSIGSALVGVCYVLDEPSIGLHQRDNDRLIQSLRDLQQLGNTVLVVEHDEAMMRAADVLIDIGPAAGDHGGRIVAHGKPDTVAGASESLTAQYLSQRQAIEVPRKRRKTAKSRSLTLTGASLNNLDNVDVRFPLGVLVCVTGVSGSGKSSLVNETLARALKRRVDKSGPRPGPHDGLRGASQVDKVIDIDQSPIGRTPRSNPATYTGAFDEVRKVFANTREAKHRGYRASRFSFNVKGGRCEECQGQGVKKIEMNFLADLYVQCDVCRGARFNRQTLKVKYRGKSIADVLAMPVEEARDFFENFSQLHRLLDSLAAVGLGYLPLGQPSTTLSGGEAQRIKLATQLARADTGQTVYLLDEPTTGLHFHDIKCLLDVLHQLVDRGNSIIVIEHNLDVVKSADWVIDMGPEGGAGGGRVIAEGTPEDITHVKESHTGRFLKAML